MTMVNIDDVHDVLAVISAVLKQTVPPEQMHMIRARFKNEYIQLEYGSSSGYVTRRDAQGWGVSLGAMRTALEKSWELKGSPNRFRPAADGRSMIRGENVESMKRMMGITPSLMEQVSGRGRGDR